MISHAVRSLLPGEARIVRGLRPAKSGIGSRFHSRPGSLPGFRSPHDDVPPRSIRHVAKSYTIFIFRSKNLFGGGISYLCPENL